MRPPCRWIIRCTVASPIPVPGNSSSRWSRWQAPKSLPAYRISTNHSHRIPHRCPLQLAKQLLTLQLSVCRFVSCRYHTPFRVGIRCFVGSGLSCRSDRRHDRATRLEKNPRGSAKLKWITAALHEGDDPICKIFSAHTIRFVSWYSLVLGCCHLVQLLYSAEFNSRCSRKLTGRDTRFFRHGGYPSS